MLRCMTSLNITAAGFVCFDFEDIGPQLLIASQRIHNGHVTLRLLRMTRARVVLLKNWMMNYGGWHFVDLPGMFRTFRPKPAHGPPCSPFVKKPNLKQPQISIIRR